MDYYTLEYSEKQGFFHYAQSKHPIKNTYKTIAKNISYDKCNKFTQYIFEKYPEVNTGQPNTPPFDTIFNEYVEFINS